MSSGRIAIVGASLAGLTAAKSLRQHGFRGRPVIIGDEPHLPYDRPPLSKEVLRGEWGTERIALTAAEAGEGDWRLGKRATALDAARLALRIDGGDWETFDGIVIATGAVPRKLPGHDLVGAHVLRTLDDALALRAELRPGVRVAIVGAGFVGQEVAASCRQLGLAVMMIEESVPAGHVLGARVGALLADMHRRHGVEVRSGVSVRALRGEGRLRTLELSDGSHVEADVAVVGVGVSPNTEWLEGSGLDIDNGVCCDETCLAAPGIVAAGDVARWPNPRFGQSRRLEHWDNAVRQGDHAARRLLQELGGPEAGPFAPVPWFWSDQYGHKFQLVGSTAGHDDVHLSRPADHPDQFVALYRRGDRLSAVATLNNTRTLLRYRRILEGNPLWHDVMAKAA